MATAVDLQAVRRAAERADDARARLEAEIRDVHARGASLRAIAEACGWSHEQVRRIVQK